MHTLSVPGSMLTRHPPSHAAPLRTCEVGETLHFICKQVRFRRLRNFPSATQLVSGKAVSVPSLVDSKTSAGNLCQGGGLTVGAERHESLGPLWSSERD